MAHVTPMSSHVPNIRLKKCAPWEGVRIKKHHDRQPDVGIGILIDVPCYRAGIEVSSESVQYYGEYIGHGKSKTAFALHCAGAEFDNKVLKISRARDMEPEVFRQACEHGLTTRIWYEGTGEDVDTGCLYHCWMTDATIALDDFTRWQTASKEKCALAAFYCIVRAAQHGLYLSDCHFYNLGVVVNENATEHLVVIIDAGSRGIHPEQKWKKADVNTRVMRKFWKACDNIGVPTEALKVMWRAVCSIEACVENAKQQWISQPLLTRNQESICGIQQSRRVQNQMHRSEQQDTSAYKIMEMVGRYGGGCQWSAQLACECYRASRTMDDLTRSEYEIVEELYSRITTSRREDQEVAEVIAFWGWNWYTATSRSACYRAAKVKQRSLSELMRC